jgi:hypothetical protein
MSELFSTTADSTMPASRESTRLSALGENVIVGPSGPAGGRYVSGAALDAILSAGGGGAAGEMKLEAVVYTRRRPMTAPFPYRRREGSGRTARSAAGP